MRTLILISALALSACASSSAESAGASAQTAAAPAVISFQNMYWGNETSRWIVPRNGEGRFVDAQRTVTFQVSAETFDRVRDILRPYENRDFECRRAIADGPYGYVIWSSRGGQETRRTQWDAGCVTGDADDLFRRLDSAMEILTPLRDAGSPAQ